MIVKNSLSGSIDVSLNRVYSASAGQSWTTELRPRALSGGRTSALALRVRPSRTRRRHAPAGRPICFACAMSRLAYSLEPSAAPPSLPSKPRRRPARLPPQKRCLQPAQSSAMTSSCSSPSPRSQSTLGEAVFSISAPWHHCRRELRRAPTRSPPRLALLHLAHCFPTISSTSFTLL